MINIWAWKDPTNQNLFFQFQVHLENSQDAFITNNYIPKSDNGKILGFMDDQEKIQQCTFSIPTFQDSGNFWTNLALTFEPFKDVLDLTICSGYKCSEEDTKCFDWKKSRWTCKICRNYAINSLNLQFAIKEVRQCWA